MYRYSSNRKAIHEGSEGGQDMNEKSQKRELDLEAIQKPATRDVAGEIG